MKKEQKFQSAYRSRYCMPSRMDSRNPSNTLALYKEEHEKEKKKVLIAETRRVDANTFTMKVQWRWKIKVVSTWFQSRCWLMWAQGTGGKRIQNLQAESSSESKPEGASQSIQFGGRWSDIGIQPTARLTWLLIRFWWTEVFQQVDCILRQFRLEPHTQI